MTIDELLNDETVRVIAFPVAGERIFMGHAGVAPIPQVAADAIAAWGTQAAMGNQENAQSNKLVWETREAAAKLIGARPEEIALLGPTSLGLSLVARGLPWQPGDEVVYYAEDYPANVYPWSSLVEFGVKPVQLRPDSPGAIDWEVVEAVLTNRTRLVALATCHFLSGYRIDIDAIGRRLRERGILFCLDGIQSVGAFPHSMEHVDFLSADSHKWMLGPVGAGIVYVRAERQEMLRPTLLGAANVRSPQFVAQEQMEFSAGATRYEPGVLNLPGIFGMHAAMQLLLEYGIAAIAARLLEVRARMAASLRAQGYVVHGHAEEAGRASGILSVSHPGVDLDVVFLKLKNARILASLRENRAGLKLLRLSPHFYNTDAEVERVLEAMSTNSG